RHIYTDGRPLPADPNPLFYGTSVGRWEDDTLVVETVGLAQVPRGFTFPYSDKMKIVERFRLTAPDSLSIETTALDPDAFTARHLSDQQEDGRGQSAQLGVGRTSRRTGRRRDRWSRGNQPPWPGASGVVKKRDHGR